MARKWSDETGKARGLCKRDRAILRELGDVANRHGQSWYRQETLAERTGYCTRSIRSALKSLEQSGWIERTPGWRNAGPMRGTRKADVIQLRTMAEAAAWYLANNPEPPAEDHGGGGDGPGPGAKIAPPSVRRLERVPATSRQPVNMTTRQRAPAQPADRRAKAAEVEAEPDAARPGDMRDLAERLKAAGHDVPAVAGTDPPARKAAG